MSFSLNEVEAVAKRAAFGADYPWGLAEEVAKAVRWLCSHGMDGCESLAKLLLEGYASNLSQHVPTQMESEWQGVGALCPAATGSILSDHSNLVSLGEITLKSVKQPMLILPFASLLSRKLNECVTIAGSGAMEFQAVVDDAELEMSGELPGLISKLTISLWGNVAHPRKKTQRAVVKPQPWEVLNRFANMTYAPATDESRLRGAGADMNGKD